MQQILPKRNAGVIFVFERDAKLRGDCSHGKVEFARAFRDLAFFLSIELALVPAPFG